MKRGLYVARINVSSPHLAGVVNKIEAQRKAFLSSGYHTDFMTLADGHIILNGKVISHNSWSKLNFHVLFHHFLGSLGSSYDFIYIRFQGCPPGLLSALATLTADSPSIPILLEIPTWPYKQERKTLRDFLRGLLSDWDIHGLHKFVHKVITFSSEISILGIETIRIQNGVDVFSLPISNPPLNGPLRLVGVANLSFWHGFDRIIEGISMYNTHINDRLIRFDIVGDGAERQNLERLTQLRGLSNSVFFHGTLRGQDLNRLLTRSNIGVSCIGMHRTNKDTTELKSRDYCARALPFIASAPDPDFPEDLCFVHLVLQDDHPVDLTPIVQWYQSLPSDFKLGMRSHAEQNLSWPTKMAPILEWLDSRY